MSDRIRLEITVERHYPDLGRLFARQLEITTEAPAPEVIASAERLADWALGELSIHAATSEQRDGVRAVHIVRVASAPDGYAALIGLETVTER